MNKKMIRHSPRILGAVEDLVDAVRAEVAEEFRVRVLELTDQGQRARAVALLGGPKRLAGKTLKPKSRRDMTCRFSGGCKARSKGPRFNYRCPEHMGKN